MADDSMEICPLRYGDEDFEFDFDLIATPEDEDSVLEDVNCFEFGAVYQSKTSTTGNDSLMNDDNNDSTLEMDDVETLLDAENNKNESDSMSLTTGNDSNPDQNQVIRLELTDDQESREFTHQNPEEELADKITVNDQANENFWEDNVPSAYSPNNDSLPKSLLSTNHSEAQQPFEQLRPSDDNYKFSTKEMQNSANVSPSLSNQDTELSGNSIVADDLNHDHSSYSISPDTSLKVLPTTENSCESFELSDTIVIYQHNEYALFSTSEHDDPNSFFIKDYQVAQKSLKEFFKAIRDVIHEDLGDEGELVISIPEFGLQTEETSSSNENITLSQIISLRRQLLLNDGVDSPPPLCIEFGIRKSFAGGLWRIIACANDGKGLSDIAPWSENSNSPKDSNASKEGPSSPSNKQFLDEKFMEKSSHGEEYTRPGLEYACEISSQAEQENGKCSNSIHGREEEQGIRQCVEDSPECDEDQNSGQFFDDVQERQKEKGQQCTYQTGGSVLKETIKGDSCDDTSNEVSRNNNLIPPIYRHTNWEVASNSCFDEESDLIDYSEDELEEDTVSTGHTTAVANDPKSDSNWTSDKTVKPNGVCDEENIITEEPNTASESANLFSFKQDSENENFEENISISLDTVISRKQNDTRGYLEDNDEYNDDNHNSNCAGIYETLSDPVDHVKNSSNINKLTALENSPCEFDKKIKQNNIDEGQEILQRVELDDRTDNLKEDTNDHETEDFQIEDEAKQFFDTVQNITVNSKTSHTAETIGPINLRKLSFDRRTEESLIVFKNSHTDINSPLTDQSGIEGDDEIGYEDEEEDELRINSKNSSTCLGIIQSEVNYSQPSNGKRSRTESQFGGVIDERDIKRSRS